MMLMILEDFASHPILKLPKFDLHPSQQIAAKYFAVFLVFDPNVDEESCVNDVFIQMSTYVYT